MIARLLLQLVLGLVGFVVAVNVIWFVAPMLGDPDVYRPLFGILLVVVGSAVWRQLRSDA